MSLQSLTPPQDITWTRLAYSRDMIDRNSADLRFPAKWRSSMAIYYYIVPDEDTADAYPNSRIIYLKMSCSITGWNPYENLYDARKIAEESDRYDDLQKSIWDAIMASYWGSTYWPCLGAIMQIAIYPNGPNISIDDFPYIMDFEPKKRELYESITEGSEILSGTSDKTSITKGTTSVKNEEVGGSIGIGIPLGGGVTLGFGSSASSTSTKTSIDQNTTDTSREARETISRTTASSQMYQLFNGYHLGTNRALFVIAPRPHIVSNSEQTGFNLIRGERKLEGIQEVFLVIHMPRSLEGFCVQASLDTGHNVMAIVPQNLTQGFVRKTKPGNAPPPGETVNPPSTPPENLPVQQIVVTQRMIKSCGKFDENGNFTIVRVPDIEIPEDISNEIAIARISSTNVSPDLSIIDKNNRIRIANELNIFQAQVIEEMVNGVSSGKYSPKVFTQTGVFRSLVAATSLDNSTPLNKLVSLKYISNSEYQIFTKNNIKTVGDLFSETVNKIPGIDIKGIRNKVLPHAK